MSNSSKDYAVDFLSGILGEPALNEEFTQGFATRNSEDKDILSNIIKSQRMDCESSGSSVKTKKDNSSKVDRIISDFLNKVKQRGVFTERSSTINKEDIIHGNEPYFANPKRFKPDNVPIKYALNNTPSPSESIRSNIFIPDTNDFGYSQEATTFPFKDNHNISIQRPPSMFARDSRFVDLEARRFINTPTANQYRHDHSFLSPKRISSPKVFLRNRFNYDTEDTRQGPFTSTQTSVKQHFNFPYNEISPIEYPNPDANFGVTNPYKKAAYTPTAFSTPFPPEIGSQRKLHAHADMFPSLRSTSTQTICKHKCLMCSSPKKAYDNINYLFEE